MFPGRKDKATFHGRSSLPLWIIVDSPRWHPTIQRLHNSQNVAGLWLKYGAKSLKIEVSGRRKILWGDATIC
jgi:hypothetical protein